MTSTHAHSIGGYRKHGCRCPICTEAATRAQRRTRARKRLAVRTSAIPSKPQPQPTPDAWASWPFDIQAAIDRAADAQFSGGVPDPRRSSRSTH